MKGPALVSSKHSKGKAVVVLCRAQVRACVLGGPRWLRGPG
jgi:hypothetical protein